MGPVEACTGGGVTITEDFQLELRDLVIGAGTIYEIPIDQMVNWWDMAEVRASDMAIPGRHGLTAGDDLYGGRSLEWAVDINATEDPAGLAAAIDALKSAFARSDVNLPLYGRMLDQDRLRWVRPRDCLVDPANVTFDWARALIRVMVVEPFAYSSDEASDSTTLTSSGGGLEFPVTFPITFGLVDGSPGTIQATNDGNAPAWWTAEIAGPITDPVITNTTTGVSFGLEGVIADGDVVSLNSKDRTILLNGNQNASYMRAPGVQWFDLQPGANAIQFDAGGEPPYGTLTMTWRSTWH